MTLRTRTRRSLKTPKPRRARGENAVTSAAKGNLSKDVFERRTSTGSEPFSPLICLDANKFVLLSFFSLIKTIYQRVSTEPLPNDAKSPLPVEVRRLKTLLLKLPKNKVTDANSNATTEAEQCKSFKLRKTHFRFMAGVIHHKWQHSER